MSNDPFNLFKLPTKKVSPKPSITTEKKSPINFKPQEFNAIFDKIAEMHDDLQKKIENTYEQSGMSYQEIKQFLENPSNFTEQEWSRVQQERLTLKDQTWSFLGEEMKNLEATKEISKSEKARKGKMLGARKNWIPMR